MFEIPRIYKKGMKYDHEKEVIITKEVDIGNGRKTKVPYIITRRYQAYQQQEKIKELMEEIGRLKEERGKDQAYIEELEEMKLNPTEIKERDEKIKTLQTQLDSLKRKNDELLNGVRESKLVKREIEKRERAEKRNSSLNKSNHELIMENLSLKRELEKYRKG